MKISLVLAWTWLMGMAVAQTPPEPGLLPGISVVNISKNSPRFASVFPQVAVSRANPNLVAVAWRRYNLPVDTNALEKDRVAECYVSISKDGGKTFTDRNMMDVLRTASGPRLWGCNAPWVAIASDGTLYFGGALFTAGGIVQVEPKAGRAGVSVSNDGGATWTKMTPGIMIDRFMPGLKGLGGGMEQQDTPWDGANGIVDPATGTFYSSAGAYLSASEDKGKSFGMVYEGRGTPSAAFGTVVAARTVLDRQGPNVRAWWYQRPWTKARRGTKALWPRPMPGTEPAPSVIRWWRHRRRRRATMRWRCFSPTTAR